MVDAQNEAIPRNVDYQEIYCKVPLQDLLDHTVERLFQSLQFSVEEEKQLVMEAKYGFDGTNVQTYKQKTVEKNHKFCDMFCTSMVPLRLIDKITGDALWTNPRPSSTALCRPIEIIYAKETPDLCKSTEKILKDEIDDLRDVKLGNVSVSFNMLLTMVDGKVFILA